jgi:hypothetical protein
VRCSTKKRFKVAPWDHASLKTLVDQQRCHVGSLEVKFTVLKTLNVHLHKGVLRLRVMITITSRCPSICQRTSTGQLHKMGG